MLKLPNAYPSLNKLGDSLGDILKLLAAGYRVFEFGGMYNTVKP